MSEKETTDHALIKLLYIILFYVVYGVTELILALITIVQTILNLLGSGPSDTLRGFGSSLGVYVKQIAEYLSYVSDHKPFPFDDWPESEVDSRE